MLLYRLAVQVNFRGDFSSVLYFRSRFASKGHSRCPHVGVLYRLPSFFFLSQRIPPIRSRTTGEYVSSIFRVVRYRNGVYPYVSNRIFSKNSSGCLVYVPLSRKRKGSATSGVSRCIVGGGIQFVNLVNSIFLGLLGDDGSASSHASGPQYEATNFRASCAPVSSLRRVHGLRLLTFFIVRLRRDKGLFSVPRGSHKVYLKVATSLRRFRSFFHGNCYRVKGHDEFSSTTLSMCHGFCRFLSSTFIVALRCTILTRAPLEHPVFPSGRLVASYNTSVTVLVVLVPFSQWNVPVLPVVCFPTS